MPDDPTVTLTPDVDPLEGNATDNVTLTCSWNTTVFYLVWFKDGTLLYSRDLVSGVTVDNTSASVEVEVEGQNSTLTFSQVNDSGNYTCAVTCRAKDSAEGDIPMQYKATKEVLIYGGLTSRNRPCLTARVLDCKEVHWNVHSCKSLQSLCCV